jgi:hypothetical protein
VIDGWRERRGRGLIKQSQPDPFFSATLAPRDATKRRPFCTLVYQVCTLSSDLRQNIKQCSNCKQGSGFRLSSFWLSSFWQSSFWLSSFWLSSFWLSSLWLSSFWLSNFCYQASDYQTYGYQTSGYQASGYQASGMLGRSACSVCMLRFPGPEAMLPAGMLRSHAQVARP